MLRQLMQSMYIPQEAMSNAAKHSHAKNLWVTLDYNAGSLEVRIEDDGRGLNEQLATKRSNGQSLGLIGMKERAMRIGANLTIDSPNGKGTRVTCKVEAAQAAHSLGSTLG
jgi:signal transduction histidine kinase